MTACTIERSMPATSVAPFSCPARQSDLIYVSGRLSYRVWTGQDGQPRHVTEVVAGEILLLDRPAAAETADGGHPADTATADSDDLPF